MSTNVRSLNGDALLSPSTNVRSFVAFGLLSPLLSPSTLPFGYQQPIDKTFVRIGSGTTTKSLVSCMLLATSDAYRTSMYSGSMVSRKSMLQSGGSEAPKDTVEVARYFGKNLLIVDTSGQASAVDVFPQDTEYVVVEYNGLVYNLVGARRGKNTQVVFSPNDSVIDELKQD